MNHASFLMVLAVLFFTAGCAPALGSSLPNGKYQINEVTGSGTNIVTMDVKDGQFQIGSSQYGLMAEGTYKVDGDQVTFTEVTSSAMAKAFCGTKVTYTYQWAFEPDKKQLKLKTVEDTCGVRSALNSGGPWAYQ